MADEAAGWRSVAEKVLDLMSSRPQLRAGHAKYGHVMVTHGPTMHTMQATRTVLTLVDANARAMVDPVTRIALEHAVWAQWLAVHPDRLEEMFSHLERKTKKQVKKLAEDGLQVPTGVADYFAAVKAPKEPDVLRYFNQMCNDLGVPTLYARAYSSLSASVHPSTVTIDSYLDDRGDPPGLLANPKVPAEIHDVAALFTVAQSALLAASAYLDLTTGKPYKPALRRIAGSGPQPLALWLTSNGKPPKGRRYSPETALEPTSTTERP